MKILSGRSFIALFSVSTQARKRFEEIPGFKEYYRRFHQELAVDRMRAICSLGMLCYAAVGIVDWTLYPHLGIQFTIARSIFLIVTAICLALSFTEGGKKRSLELLFVAALVGDLAISYMCSQITGWNAVYFVGNILVTVAITMFAPWPPRMIAVYCLSSLTGYVLINRMYHPFELEMMIPVSFMTVVGIQVYFSTMGQEYARMRQVASRLEIEQAHQELKAQSELLQQQIEAAKDIQQALLPPLSQSLKGVKIEAIYEPSAHLSGDFFDATVEGDWVYVYLADVTGHGLPAAQITFLVKEIFKTALGSGVGELPELFEVVRNKYVDHQLKYDLGLQLLRIHSRTGQIQMLKSNAPSPIIVEPGTEAHELDIPASPLISASIRPNDGQRAQVSEHQFQRGMSLYLCSDGAYEFVTEAGREFGLRRLMKTINSLEAESWARELSTRLKAENRAEAFPDDLTVIRIALS